MALHLNLLHEEILEQRQRQRDPLKIGIYVLAGIGALLLLYYMWNVYRTLETKSRLSTLNNKWARVEPTVTAAQKRVDELNGVIKATRALDDYIDNRFFWGPFLQKVSECVAPNTQLTGLTGAVLDDNKGVEVSIEGVAAGREPRSVAEDLRQMLIEQLKKAYGDVKVEFKSLEDVDQIAMVGGTHLAMARYTLTISLKVGAKPAASPAPGRGKKK
ncbi:MAG: hypothetical protein ABI925_04400 [Verrucomicrobiota bacterium]